MKPRVLYLTSEYSLRNGWGTCAVNWIEGLRQDVAHAEILTMADARNDVAPWPMHAILRSASDGRWKSLAMAWDGWRVARRCPGHFDIVHSLIEPFAPLGDRLAKRFAGKSMIQLHGTYCVFPVNTKWITYYEKAYQCSESIIANSHYTRQRALEEFPNLDIEVAHLGVDKTRFTTDETQVSSEPFFLFVGASKPRKGLLTALRGFKDFLQKHDGYRFHVVGNFDNSTQYNQKVTDFIQKAKLPVKFLGSVTHQELVHQFQRCTAHVLPSESESFVFEGFGLVHLEANLCGSLTIGSKDSANEEVIEDGESGFLVPQKDFLAVAQAMQAAVKRVAVEESRVRTQCVEHARSYSWDKSVQAVLDVYRRSGESS